MFVSLVGFFYIRYLAREWLDHTPSHMAPIPSHITPTPSHMTPIPSHITPTPSHDSHS